ncbi:magnesium/cobalt transporter CorA [Neoasaia chiangmaiensis NBRC 101099]|uniref:Magnesium transporter n=1 Tax=Neoasaia chiangmaiensis TaxID=320497 RepID=A0A1U9KQB3_9PROT|nr:magnesium transporter CorA family protein [Neoasaia chiangmaiensis]AQS87998.1 magnesium transporter [Neoasaia chiangmaiensis]GBR38889.1 magnesium/cobalt transporter CorA [Neoasaia chiangmaiensis NBRC 101099]GEN15663.1 magnesium transport protein CorA [Neoasaia chiangmaiensis]
MFLARPPGTTAHEIIDDRDIDHAAWLDLINPTPEELSRAQRLTGLTMPRREELEEIESSSRHYKRDNVVYLSTPLVRRHDGGETTAFPVGLVLTDHLVITVRYSDYTAFDVTGREVAEWPEDNAAPDAPEIMVILLEAMINRLADVLEGLGRTLDDISRKVFAADTPRRRARSAEMLRETLRRLGRGGDLASYIRDSLLGLDRMGIFLADSGHYTLSGPLQVRMKVAGRDIASLNDFVAQNMNKVQFLLDATLGFISIEQNDGMKLLTVVSFVGIAPTLIAGIYGMNFKNIPELDWHYGYYYCLGLMALSVIVPLGFFWRRGWFGDR